MNRKKTEKEFPEHLTWPVTVEGTLKPPETDACGRFIGVPNNPYKPPA